jgi:hypothetical protein
MGRKYCCKHPDRGVSNYRERLVRRGLSRTPPMQSLQTLRKKQTGKEAVPETAAQYAGWDFADMSGI